MSNNHTSFTSWLNDNAPEWLSKHRGELVQFATDICLINTKQQQFVAQHVRPAHHAGIPLATSKQPWKLLPASVLELQDALPVVELSDHASQLVSYGKHVLFEGIVNELDSDVGRFVSLQHNGFAVGIGRVLKTSGQPHHVAIHTVVHVGSFLRR